MAWDLNASADATSLVGGDKFLVSPVGAAAASDLQWGTLDLLRSAVSGAVTVSPGDDLNAAAAEAKADGVALLLLPGAYTAAVTVVFDCNVLAAPGAVLTSSANPAVQLGAADEPSQWLEMRLPRVLIDAKTWAAGNLGDRVGVNVRRLVSCSVWLPEVRGFSVGVDMTPAGGGCVYTKLFVGHLNNNATNLRLQPGVGGWVNDCQFHGGRYSHDSDAGEAVAGTRHVQILAPGTYQPNNNWWFGGSVEGDVAEYALHAQSKSCGFVGLRWETTGGGRVFWDHDATSGHYAQRNLIVGGYNVENLDVSASSEGRANSIVVASSWSATGDADGVFRGKNPLTSSGPVLTLYENPVQNVDLADADEWSAQIGSNLIQMKRRADATARVTINGQLGTVLAAGGIGVGNSAAATTPGTVVRKMEVFDASGNSLGFVPIYDAIT